MIIYNVTIKIGHEIHEEWLGWMKETHMPDVLQTGCFLEHKICRLLDQDESDGITYNIQYLCESAEMIEKYQAEFAPALQQKHSEKYKDRFVAFRTLMEVV
ncbi:MAG TPA: DUF4286 family protein [Flavobacteriales bacterium]|nr:DUF4286 family protein [Flavobacteriales bacterium]